MQTPTASPASAVEGCPTVLASVGLALNSLAWVLVAVLGSYIRQRFHLAGPTWAVAVVAPLIIGSVGRVPVGALTDRYGARITLPLVSAGSAAAVLLLAYADSVGVLLLACLALGVPGTAFPVTVSLMARGTRGVRRRGFEMSVLGLGTGAGAVAAVGVVRPLAGPLTERSALLLVVAALLGYAVVAAVRVPGVQVRRSTSSMRADVEETLRLSVTRHWFGLYGIVLGGVLSMILYLPVFLNHLYGLALDEAALDTAVFVAVSAASWPLGGWLVNRVDPTHTLTWCFAVVGVLGMLLAFLTSLTVASGAFLTIGLALGIASGVLVGLIGSTVPPDRAGLVSGVVGAGGGLAGLVPPVVLDLTDDFHGAHAFGLMILADVVFAAALYLRLRRRSVRYRLAYPASPPPPLARESTATSVVAVPEDTLDEAATAAFATLAHLAVRYELVVVYGHEPETRPPQRLLTAIRTQLPRYQVVAVYVDAPPELTRTECEIVATLLNDGVITIAVVSGRALVETAQALAGWVHADATLRLEHDPDRGVQLVDLRQPATPASI